MRRSKKTANEHPWYKYYKEAGYPEHIDYPDCALVDMVMKSAEQWPENVAYIYYGHKVTYRTQKLRCQGRRHGHHLYA